MNNHHSTHTNLPQNLPAQFSPDVHPSEELDFYSPSFKFGDVVLIRDESIPIDQWNEYRITAMEIIVPHWQNPDSFMDAPTWRYGIRCQGGTQEIVWFASDEIIPKRLAHAYSLEPEF